MFIKLDSLNDWHPWPSNSGLPLPAITADGKERKIRIQVNCEEETAFHVHSAEWDAPRFLAAVQGFAEIEFWLAGDAIIDASGDGQVAFYTPEKDIIWAESDGATFTQLLEARHRNPQLEMMMFIMRENERRRDAAMEQERAMLRDTLNQINGETDEQPKPKPKKTPPSSPDQSPESVGHSEGVTDAPAGAGASDGDGVGA